MGVLAALVGAFGSIIFRGRPRGFLTGVGLVGASIGIRSSSAAVLDERCGCFGILEVLSRMEGVEGCLIEARRRCQDGLA